MQPAQDCKSCSTNLAQTDDYNSIKSDCPMIFLFSKFIWQKQDRDKGKDDDDDLENTKKIEKRDKVNKKQ